ELYDPLIDDRDEKWATAQRQGRKSDAILSCPACFTTLCLDCQRHEIYVTQYRAMFVRNCRVCEDEFVEESRGDRRKSQRKRKREPLSSIATPAAGAGAAAPTLRRVRCAVCSVEVGAIDSDEVYHFFTALPSYS
ncbi:hypothetical protein SELMODRAFT_122200, partial [Selaginella moellendorffii]